MCSIFVESRNAFNAKARAWPTSPSPSFWLLAAMRIHSGLLAAMRIHSGFRLTKQSCCPSWHTFGLEDTRRCRKSLGRRGKIEVVRSPHFGQHCLESSELNLESFEFWGRFGAPHRCAEAKWGNSSLGPFLNLSS
jgi:hypothetical protein